VLGNPLKYTDLDGLWILVAVGAAIYFTAQTSDDENIYRTGTIIGLAMMGGSAASGGMFTGGTGAAMANGATIGFTTSYLSSGGNFHEGAKGGITGAFSGALAHEIGHGFGANWHWSAQAVAHGTAQGLITEARGGEFRNGFIGGVMGKAGGVAAGEIGGPGIEAIAARTVIVSTFAGLAAEATGGSFRDAALSAAMTHLFNEESGRQRRKNMIARLTIDTNNNMLIGYNSNGDVLFKADVVTGCPGYETPKGDLTAGNWTKDKTNPKYGPTPWSQDISNPYGPYFLRIRTKTGGSELLIWGNLI
jgi:hypothetical protein